MAVGKDIDHRAHCQYAPCPESVLDKAKCCRRTYPNCEQRNEIDKQIKRMEANDKAADIPDNTKSAWRSSCNNVRALPRLAQDYLLDGSGNSNLHSNLLR